MKNFKTYAQFILEGKAVDKVKQQEEDMDAKELADILIITDVDEAKLNEISESILITQVIQDFQHFSPANFL